MAPAFSLAARSTRGAGKGPPPEKGGGKGTAPFRKGQSNSLQYNMLCAERQSYSAAPVSGRVKENWCSATS